MDKDYNYIKKGMKSLYQCISEEMTTPGNTMGMGNPMAPTETQPGTEPIAPINSKKKKTKCNKGCK